MSHTSVCEGKHREERGQLREQLTWNALNLPRIPCKLVLLEAVRNWICAAANLKCVLEVSLLALSHSQSVFVHSLNAVTTSCCTFCIFVALVKCITRVCQAAIWVIWCGTAGITLHFDNTTILMKSRLILRRKKIISLINRKCPQHKHDHATLLPLVPEKINSWIIHTLLVDELQEQNSGNRAGIVGNVVCRHKSPPRSHRTGETVCEPSPIITPWTDVTVSLLASSFRRLATESTSRPLRTFDSPR